MPMDKAIAGEGKGVKSGETGHYRFHLAFQNIPWAKTNIIIAYPNIIIANKNMIIAYLLLAISCQLLLDEIPWVKAKTKGFTLFRSLLSPIIHLPTTT